MVSSRSQIQGQVGIRGKILGTDLWAISNMVSGGIVISISGCVVTVSGVS